MQCRAASPGDTVQADKVLVAEDDDSLLQMTLHFHTQQQYSR